MSKFKLGPLQEAWVKQLERYPMRHIEGVLGNVKEKQHCCLGQGLELLHQKKALPTVNGKYPRVVGSDTGLFCGEDDGTLKFNKTYELLGLRGPLGEAKEDYLPAFINNCLGELSLVEINDQPDLLYYYDFEGDETNPKDIKKLRDFIKSAIGKKQKFSNWTIIAHLLRTYPRAYFKKSV